jgi:cytochrome c-type biogenesis protein CcmE
MLVKRKKNLYFICFVFILALAIAALMIYALNQNMNLFYTPSQILNNEAPLNARIRVGGMVEKNSLVRGDDLSVSFIVTDLEKKIKIQYKGILPDLFREGQGVVALGKLTNNTNFVADQILAKHDENYMPPEVSDSLKKGKL